MLTVDIVSETLPPGMKNMVTQSLVDRVNNLDADPHLAEAMRQNFISYTSVLMEGKYRLEDYLNAVKFVSYLLMRYSKRDAWIRTFPDRYQTLKEKGADKKTISAHVSMYAGGQLVNLIVDRSVVPFHVLNQDLRQKAVERLAHVMATAQSDFVVVQAANGIIAATTPPKEVKAAQLQVNVGVVSTVNSLEKALGELAQQQKKMIEAGHVSTKSVAESRIIDSELVKP